MSRTFHWWSTVCSYLKLFRAAKYLRANNLKEALPLLSQSIEAAPDKLGAFLLRGSTWYRLGKFELALADYDSAINLDPTFAQSFLDRGLVYASLNRYNEANADLTRALELQPKLCRAYYERAGTWSRLGKSQNAIDDYSEVLALEPRTVAAYVERAQVLMEIGFLDRALSDLETAIKKCPQFADAYVARGVCFVKLGQLERALADFTEAIRQNASRSASAYYHRGGIQADNGNLASAIQDYTMAIKIDGGCADYYNGRALAFSQSRDYGSARADFQAAIALAPTDVFIYRNFGRMLVGIGAYKEGLEVFENATEFSPACADALGDLAWLLATCPDSNIRDGPRSLALASKVAALSGPTEWRKQMISAAAYAECLDFDAAIAVQESADSIIPEDQKPLARLAIREYRNKRPLRQAHSAFGKQPAVPNEIGQAQTDNGA